MDLEDKIGNLPFAAQAGHLETEKHLVRKGSESIHDTFTEVDAKDKVRINLMTSPPIADKDDKISKVLIFLTKTGHRSYTRDICNYFIIF